MKVALIGISGRVGSRIFAELRRRGHTVTGIVRDTAKMMPSAGLEVKAADANHPAELVPLLAGHDAVTSAMRFAAMDTQALIAAVKQAGVPRLLVVGGAGSLDVVPGKTLASTPDFPDAYKREAAGGQACLDALRAERALDWTMLSPSAEFVPGARTGTFRLGGDRLLVDAHGKSWVTMEDFAIALVDELEEPKHPRQRFTVGY